MNIVQRFHNTSKFSTGRAKYVFPIPAGAAVCAFEMHTADNRVIVGEVKEKTKAQEDHEQAIREGNRTALVDCISGDSTCIVESYALNIVFIVLLPVFTISIGPIPGEQSVITIITVCRFS